jgi:hypothetical protein
MTSNNKKACIDHRLKVRVNARTRTACCFGEILRSGRANRSRNEFEFESQRRTHRAPLGVTPNLR